MINVFVKDIKSNITSFKANPNDICDSLIKKISKQMGDPDVDFFYKGCDLTIDKYKNRKISEMLGDNDALKLIVKPRLFIPKGYYITIKSAENFNIKPEQKSLINLSSDNQNIKSGDIFTMNVDKESNFSDVVDILSNVLKINSCDLMLLVGGINGINMNNIDRKSRHIFTNMEMGVLPNGGNITIKYNTKENTESPPQLQQVSKNLNDEKYTTGKNMQGGKPSQKPYRKPSRKPSRKSSRKPSRKPSRKTSRKQSRKPSRKQSRKPSRKQSRKLNRKLI
jgi:hypothetical protein